MTFKILIVEDEPDFREVLVEYLELKGYEATGVESMAQYQSLPDPQVFDLIVLDRTLPDGDGINILKSFRKYSAKPVIILSGLGDLDERVKGLEADADYYLVKPVKTPELLAIVNRYARRARPATPVGAYWKICPKQWELISPSGVSMKLTKLEMGFLHCFEDAEGVSISREHIVQALGHRPELYDLRRLETMVSRLRNKTKEVGIKEFPLATVYGSGYVFNAMLKVLQTD